MPAPPCRPLRPAAQISHTSCYAPPCRLCELPDTALDPTYLRQRAGLTQLVHHMAAPKLIKGTEAVLTPSPQT